VDLSSLPFLNDLTSPLAWLLLVAAVAWLASRVVVALIYFVARRVSAEADISEGRKVKRFHRLETYLGMTAALVRTSVVLLVLYFAWRLFAPGIASNILIVMTSALLIVLGNTTVGPIIRDMTSGIIMIVEKWYSVGDFIRIEPFVDLSGVVERFTPRSTRIRSLNGELTVVHNQYIQAVRITPQGVRTQHVDIFVREHAAGRRMIERVMETMPRGTLKIVGDLQIIDEEEWAKGLWYFVVAGKTAPGREWLINSHFIESLQDADKEHAKSLLARTPIARFADPAAERSFRRAVRAK